MWYHIILTVNSLQVTVTDVNDNRAQFSALNYHFSVHENLDIGAVVAQITASDLDYGINGQYTILKFIQVYIFKEKGFRKYLVSFKVRGVPHAILLPKLGSPQVWYGTWSCTESRSSPSTLTPTLEQCPWPDTSTLRPGRAMSLLSELSTKLLLTFTRNLLFWSGETGTSKSISFQLVAAIRALLIINVYYIGSNSVLRLFYWYPF